MTHKQLAKFHRYTITSEGASPGYFRLVEDNSGAWIAWAEVARLLAESNGERLSIATRLKGIIESIVTGEPRRDCEASLMKIVKEIER